MAAAPAGRRPHFRRPVLLAAAGVAAAASFLVLLYYAGRDAARCYPAPPAAPSDTCAMHGYGWQLPGTRTLAASVWSSETRWGNELSRYWQGRAMARLGGLAFVAVGDFTHAWLRYLPRRLPAGAPPTSCAAFDAACGGCFDWKYSHKCLGGWTAIGDEVIADTRAALAAYAAAHRRALPRFAPQDVVIQNRCSKDVWFWHGEYGPAAFSLYRSLPPNTTGTIYIVGTSSQERGPRAHAAYTGKGLFPPCVAKLAALQACLAEWYPRARVVLGSTLGDTFDDFAFMALAPTLVKDSSSFGLWAGMANNGSVVSPRVHAYGDAHTFANPHWVWSQAEVLYPDVARRLGLNTSDTDAVIEWLRTH